MKLSLITETDPKLQEVSEEWDFEKDGDPNELVKEMTRIMFLHGGIGLSAVQCGVMKRIFLMGNPDSLVVCINPKIIELSDERELYQEGCLSFPNLWLKVKRPKSVRVSYQTVTGELVEKDLDGIHARVFLHEFDHLMGITFDQRTSELGLKMAKERRKKAVKKLK
jgi:peptide deformylase